MIHENEEYFDISIQVLVLPEEIEQTLEDHGVALIGDLVAFEEETLIESMNLNSEQVFEIVQILEGINFSLGMDVGNWVSPAVDSSTLLDLPIGELNLPPELEDKFTKHGQFHIGDLVSYEVGVMKSAHELTDEQVDTITEALNKLGLYLEMNTGDWEPPVANED